MPTSYARFFKCDLQMQTPGDPHWRDPETRISASDEPSRRIDVARDYLRACHAAGLEVIGVTDHNLGLTPQASMLNELLSENNAVAAEMGRAPLVILPGFEIEANVGKGCHVLCLFPPGTPLAVVDARLTALQLPPDARFNGTSPRATNQTLAQIIQVVQRASSFAGLVIAPHPISSNGLFDTDRIAEWLQQEEFTNPELLCLEVPKPPSEMSENWQRLLRSGPDCDQSWRRRRPIACVMSSDCYRFAKVDGEHGNFIGHRSTWIRMTIPSIEALRQAFLDHSSRIRFGDVSPDARSVHPRLLSASISGMSFLRRTETITWSPNLNCVIGSRGTGKSSLVDYIRHALDRTRDSDIAPGLREEVRERVNGTLTKDARIEVRFATLGGEYRVVCEGKPLTRTMFVGESAVATATLDVRTLFPCRFLSQREIDQGFGKRDVSTMRRLLDEFIAPELVELHKREEDTTAALSALRSELNALDVRQARRSALETERTDLRGTLTQQERLNAVLPEWTRSESEREAIDHVRTDAEKLRRDLAVFSDSLTTEWESPILADGQVADEALTEFISEANASRLQLREALKSAIDEFAGGFQTPGTTLNKALDKWGTKHSAIQERFQREQEAASQAESVLIDAALLPAQILAIEQQLSTLDDERKRITEAQSERIALVASLRETWNEETQARREKARSLMERLRSNASLPPLVQIDVKHQSDLEEVVVRLSELIPDHRRLGEADIRILVGAVSDIEPEDLMRHFIDLARGPQSQILETALGSRVPAFRDAFPEAVLRELEERRVADSVTYLVHRTDGTLAGPIDKVSAGQQGTAILNILLAEGTDPLIIDTPEEGLDSEGVYQELVPLFRREKWTRQLIVVTHNANIPVNADAENIVALEACGYIAPTEIADRAADLGNNGPEFADRVDQHLRFSDWRSRMSDVIARLGIDASRSESLLDGLGASRNAEARLRLDRNDLSTVVGALDRESVKRAVQDVMEGSEDAFQRRGEMYGY